jgi:hypothetical protein
VKYSGLLPKLIILACAVCLAPSSFALDEFGDPSPLVTQSTDGESPDTRILAIQETEQQGILLISYQVESALDGLDHVELYFRKNGFESFSRYTEPTTGNPQGHFYPEVNGQGTILFDSTRRGGDGEYAFYTKTGDTRKPGTDHGFLISTLDWQLKLIVVGCLFPRSSGLAGPGTPADHRGDLPLETLAAEREGAVGRIPNGCKIALRDLIGEEVQVASAARFLALGEGAINRVRNDHRIADAQSVATVARPRIIARGLYHVRANRVQLDVALAGEQIAVRLDDRRAKAPFEKRAGPTVGPVDVLHLALSQSLHKQRRSPIGCRCHEQVQMIGHEHQPFQGDYSRGVFPLSNFAVET